MKRPSSYPGQGTAVPTETGFDGEWISFGEVFIYKSTPPGSQGNIAGITRPDGGECDGFDANWLAAQLETTVEELFELNRKHLLMVEIRRVATGPGADITLEFVTRTPTTGVRQQVSRAAIKGNA